MSRATWKFDDETYEFIKGEVTFILERYTIKCIPVSGFEIASKMGIPIIPYSSLQPKVRETLEEVDPDGFVAASGVDERIYYNDVGRSYERQNMTILHELGHIVLGHRGVNVHREEDEADFFAKYAIAPPVLVDRIKAQYPDDIYQVFDISREASVYAFDYYMAWKNHHESSNEYTSYEIKQLDLLNKQLGMKEQDYEKKRIV